MAERPVKRSGDPAASPRRAYTSRKRQQASLETRRRIRATAEVLFLRDGYVRTTTKAIARAAGVSEMTVFLAFDTKAALLSEIIRTTVRDDDHDTPIAGRASWQEILDAPPDEILARFAQFNAAVQIRTARILTVAEAAATTDQQLAERRESAHAHVRADFQQVADALAGHRRLAAHVSTTHAADVLYGITNPATYLLLTDECGWSTQRYVDWLTTTLTATLTGSLPREP
jgi:AcrR family transcriptional regulator